jgi:hypothetical protein
MMVLTYSRCLSSAMAYHVLLFENDISTIESVND